MNEGGWRREFEDGRVDFNVYLRKLGGECVRKGLWRREFEDGRVETSV